MMRIKPFQALWKEAGGDLSPAVPPLPGAKGPFSCPKPGAVPGQGEAPCWGSARDFGTSPLARAAGTCPWQDGQVASTGRLGMRPRLGGREGGRLRLRCLPRLAAARCFAFDARHHQDVVYSQEGSRVKERF